MAYTPKDNSGSLFKNSDKKTETHADYKGDALIDGTAYFVDAWVNEVKSGPNAGKKFFGMKFKRKERQAGASRQQETSSTDIP